MLLQRVEHDLVTKQQQQQLLYSDTVTKELHLQEDAVEGYRSSYNIRIMAMGRFQDCSPYQLKQGTVIPLKPLDQESRDFNSLTGRVDGPI